MALANELVRVGVPPVTASAMGGTAAAVTATSSSTLATAVELTASVNRVTGADGVRLPSFAQPGDSVIIVNDTGSTVKVWPPTSSAAIGVPGTSFGSAVAGASYAHTTYAVVRYTCNGGGLWMVNKSA